MQLGTAGTQRSQFILLAFHQGLIVPILTLLTPGLHWLTILSNPMSAAWQAITANRCQSLTSPAQGHCLPCFPPPTAGILSSMSYCHSDRCIHLKLTVSRPLPMIDCCLTVCGWVLLVTSLWMADNGWQLCQESCKLKE